MVRSSLLVAVSAAIAVAPPPVAGRLLAAVVVDFEDIAFGVGESNVDGSYSDPLLDDAVPQGSGSGASRATSFVSRGTAFSNWYDREWFVWTGFAITNLDDPTPSNPIYLNQYSAAAGPAFGGTKYAVAYASSYGLGPVIDLPAGYDAASVRVTNTTYALAAIRDGDPPYSRKFGNDPATPGVVETSYPDHFSVFFKGYSGSNATGSLIGTVEFVLADYRFSNDALDFIVDAWTEVDLSNLEGARSIGISWFSTDTVSYDGSTYISTPTYVAIDNLTLVPEPSGWAILACGAFVAAAVRLRRRRFGSL